jgi:hypothetical protein
MGQNNEIEVGKELAVASQIINDFSSLDHELKLGILTAMKHCSENFMPGGSEGEEHYFISFWASTGIGKGEVENDCIDEHPFEWQHRMNMAGPGVEVVENGLTAVLISWKKIEKIEFDLFHA